MDYLRCEYGPGLFKSEYIIKFKVANPAEFNWLFVNKEDVKPLDEKNGLIKLKGCYESRDGMVLVHINDVADYRTAPFVVYLEYIVRE